MPIACIAAGRRAAIPPEGSVYTRPGFTQKKAQPHPPSGYSLAKLAATERAGLTSNPSCAIPKSAGQYRQPVI